jgi:glycosyltransferase involved in cell wall biosynthesis
MEDIVNKRKRILMDGRFVGVGDSMSRYTLELVKGFLQADSDFEFTLLVRPQGEKIAREFLTLDSGLRTRDFSIDVLDIPHYSLAEQTQLLRYLKRKKFDLVHFIQFNHPVRYRGKFVVTIHDLTLFGHLYRKSRIKGLAFHRVMKSATRNSSRIITISKTSKAAIVESYEVDPKKIEVTYLGVDERYSSDTARQLDRIQQVKDKYHIVDQYILYTGMWKRHKNLLRLLKAFELYKIHNPEPCLPAGRSKLQLVLAGKIDEKEPEVINEIKRINSSLCHPDSSPLCHCEESGDDSKPQSPLGGRQSPTDVGSILAVGFVDEADLPYLYAGALAYCIPSLSEGFGLPPLEAMAVGTPVISSNVSAMPEILGDASLYFDPYSVHEIEKAINRIIIDEKLRSDLSKKGTEQAAKYSWSETAKETLDIYKKII